ncbi:MAG: GNAT family N-acetyltransferase [Sedimenticola sp.]|nr:GNAT family N-acetyltransferase [Sedimenticola sp.]
MSLILTRQYRSLPEDHRPQQEQLERPGPIQVCGALIYTLVNLYIQNQYEPSLPMSELEFNVSQVQWAQYRPQLREIRRQVFIMEQNVPRELEWDDKDETALHVIAVDSEGNGIGTGRISNQGQIGRMAVLREWRNRGVGGTMLRKLLWMASQAELPTLYLNAQQSAIPFYRRHGFVPVGDTFIEAGIPHQRMQLRPNSTTAAPST